MYGKIYEQTFTGSMYGSGSHIFAVWSYVIAHTKPDAMVELNPMDLASRLGEDVARIEQAIEYFKSPDVKSRSKEFEGRRLIQKGEYIYFVPQYHKYHGFANNKERREYFAQKKREQRQRLKERQTVMSKMSNNVQQSDTESDTETKTKKSSEVPDFISQLKSNVFYAGIDIDGELVRAKRWCERKGRRCTRRFFENWLGRADRLVELPKPKVEARPARESPEAPALSEEELKERKEKLGEQMRELREKFRMPS